MDASTDAVSQNTPDAASTCEDLASCPVMFSYPTTPGVSSVALRGSFDGWGSGVALALMGDHWETSLNLPDGTTVTYKFVLNGTDWVQDPGNAETQPDGFGGFNSLLTVHCDACNNVTSATDPAWTPDEPLPDAFDFPPWITMPAANQIVVSWRTVASTTGTVRYGTSPTTLDHTVISANPGELHHADLGVLSPATAYYYEVAIDGTNARRRGVFVVPGMDNWRFVHLGEFHAPSESAHTAAFASAIRAFRPHVVVESGDMVDNGDDLAHWRSYMRTAAPWISNVILLPAHSNHVNGFQGNALVHDLFVLPGNERWYTTRVGQIEFITVDSTFDTDNFPEISEVETAWLQDRVAEAHDGVDDPALVIAAWHYPACSSHYPSRGDLRSWIFDNLLQATIDGGGIDMLLVGHDKYYERSLINGSIVQVQANAGKLSPESAGGNHAGCEAVATDTAARSVPLFTVTGSQLHASVRNEQGSVIDSFTVGN